MHWTFDRKVYKGLITTIMEVSKMSKKVTIKLNKENAFRLLRKKELGESYDDVIKKLLDLHDKKIKKH